MTRDETIALFLQGREAWNAWAEGMLAERKALEEAGEWAVETDFIGPLKGQNDKTRDWVKRASVDFSRCRVVRSGAEASSLRGPEAPNQSRDLHRSVLHRHGADAPRDDDEDDGLITIEVADRFDCVGFIFPANASFASAQVHTNASFASADFHAAASFASAQFHAAASFASAQFHAAASFASAQFHARASFRSAQFHAAARFASARFHNAADLRRAQFYGPASFGSTQFHSTAWFQSAQFHANASFHSAQFHARASFRSAQFHAAARFDSAQFHAPTFFNSASFAAASFDSAEFHALARFASASFAAATTFRDAAFGMADKPADADFTGIKVERAFDLTGASFSKVPSFNQADFVQPPDLDDVTYPISGFWRRGNRDDIPRYRHLRRIALGGHNHDAEAMAFKGETRAKRFTEHGWLSLALYAGMFYDAVSDFGRSIVRPLLVWLVSMPVFTLFYLLHAGKLSAFDQACGGSAAWLSALVFSVKSALLIVPWDEEQLRSAYACLYGVNFSAGETVPPVSAFIQGGQTVFSAVVVFLLLLGVRNQFKIK